MSIPTVVHSQLRSELDALEERTPLVLLLAIVPIVLTTVFFIVHSVATGTESEAYGLPTAYLFYGLSSAVTVAGLYGLLSTAERDVVFRFRRPSLRELGWAVVAFPAGVGVYLVTSRVSAALGHEMQGLSYTLSDPTTVAIVVVGAVILAPLTEEVLYRGLVLGTLLSRGYGVLTSVVGMTGLFALIHLPNFGVAGTLFISVWGLLPAALRVRFDNLSGAVLMHAANNAYAYLVVVALGLA